MKTYAEAQLEEFNPFPVDDPATLRRRLHDARAVGSLAKGAIGPLVIRHAAVSDLLHDKRLRGPGMDFARMFGSDPCADQPVPDSGDLRIGRHRTRPDRRHEPLGRFDCARAAARCRFVSR